MTLEMREEITAAVVFITRLVRQNGSVSKEKVEEFSGCLSAILVEKFKNHWYLDHPEKGQGYRCIRINDFEPIDPVLEKAACDSGLKYGDLRLPSELTLWVDPDDVCCRIGESHGSFCTLAAKKDGSLENRAHSVNIEELLQEGKERHNQQVNIVTTRSNIGSGGHHRHGFSKGLHYNTNYYSKQQHNFYNNQQFQNTHNRFRPQNKNHNRKQPMVQEQVNGVRHSPEHVNEVRQKFLEQVTTAAKSTSADKTTHTNSENPKANTSSIQTSSSSSDQSTVNTANDTASKSNNSDLNKSTSSNTSSSGPKPQSNTSKSGTTSTATGPKSTQHKGKSLPHSNNTIKPGSYHGGKSQNNKGAYPHPSVNQKLAQKVY